MLEREGVLLRILLGENDRHDGKLLYEWLVLKAREMGLAGATVLRGVMGFGGRSLVHTFRIERLSEDLPVVIEIVDARERVEAYLEAVDGVIEGGLATLESVRVHWYRGAP